MGQNLSYGMDANAGENFPPELADRGESVLGLAGSIGVTMQHVISVQMVY